MDQVRKLAATLSGDACAVLFGGMKTAATSKASWETREIWFDGHCEVCPSVTHILWECPAFEHLRQLPRPDDVLQTRIGWSHLCVKLRCKPMLEQMGRIRAAEVASRRSRAGARRYRRSGGVGFVEPEVEQLLYGCQAADPEVIRSCQVAVGPMLGMLVENQHGTLERSSALQHTSALL